LKLVSSSKLVSPNFSVEHSKQSDTMISSQDAAHEFGALNTLLIVVLLGLCILAAYLIKQNSFYYLPESAAAILVGLVVGGLARYVIILSMRDESEKRSVDCVPSKTSPFQGCVSFRRRTSIFNIRSSSIFFSFAATYHCKLQSDDMHSNVKDVFRRELLLLLMGYSAQATCSYAV
jgi:hypothetical protein